MAFKLISPEPPAGHGVHRYRFKLPALDVPALEVPPDADVRAVEEAAEAHAIDRQTLTGRFERKSKQM